MDPVEQGAGDPRDRLPFLMACPGATLLAVTDRDLVPTTLEKTSHYEIFRHFMRGPSQFIERMLGEGADGELDAS